MTLDGNRVRRFLKERGESKEWLAVQLGCSLTTVANILAGKMPRSETLVVLAKKMGVKVEELTPGEPIDRAS